MLAGGYPLDNAGDTDDEENEDEDASWVDEEMFPVRITLVDGVAGVDPAPEFLAEPVDGFRADQHWCVHSGGVTRLLDPDVRGTAGGGDD